MASFWHVSCSLDTHPLPPLQEWHDVAVQIALPVHATPASRIRPVKVAEQNPSWRHTVRTKFEIADMSSQWQPHSWQLKQKSWADLCSCCNCSASSIHRRIRLTLVLQYASRAPCGNGISSNANENSYIHTMGYYRCVSPSGISI